MVASKSTMERVIEIFREEMDEETMKRILRRLLEVPGNRSFMDTIRAMNREVNR